MTKPVSAHDLRAVQHLILIFLRCTSTVNALLELNGLGNQADPFAGAVRVRRLHGILNPPVIALDAHLVSELRPLLVGVSRHPRRSLLRGGVVGPLVEVFSFSFVAGHFDLVDTDSSRSTEDDREHRRTRLVIYGSSV